MEAESKTGIGYKVKDTTNMEKKPETTAVPKMPTVCSCDTLTHMSSGYRSNMSNLSGDSGMACSFPSTSGSLDSRPQDRQRMQDSATVEKSSCTQESGVVEGTKKATLKKCLNELRSLMTPATDGTSENTVDTLQKVLKEIKKMKDVEEHDTRSVVDTQLVGGDDNLGEYQLPGTEANKSWMQIVLSMRDFKVLQVSNGFMEMLGYPKNYWFNQSLLDYAYKRDVVMLSSHLTACSHDAIKLKKTVPQKNTLFFRLRHFKSLRQGFSLSRSERYSVFCTRASCQKIDLHFPPGTPAEGLHSNHMYIVLECTPLQSSYTAVGVLPMQRSFMTRQTVYSNFNFVHPAAIPLLGYLPQDMIGTSVFDYYHPRDLPMLVKMYRQVIDNPGQMIGSRPYLMRTRNGEYISIETEWSSFVNPWTKQLDFIMGHHTVLKGPLRLDVLGETLLSKGHLELSSESKGYIKQIKSMLLPCAQVTLTHEAAMGSASQTCSPEPSSSIPAQGAIIPWEDLTATISLAPTNTVKTTGSPSPSIETDDLQVNMEESENDEFDLYRDKKEILYGRLNYAQNILRFLTSQVHMFDEKKAQIREATKAEESDCSDNDMEMDLPIPKPPSCASSTKALVSELEREELMPPSPAQEEVPEEVKVTEPDDIYEPVSLTKNVLAMHTKLQEENYIKHMMQERGGFVTPDGRFRGFMLNTKRARKRTQLPQEDLGMKSIKYLRMDNNTNQGTRYTNTSTLFGSMPAPQPPFPMTQVVSLHTMATAVSPLVHYPLAQTTQARMSEQPFLGLPNSRSANMYQLSVNPPHHNVPTVTVTQPGMTSNLAGVRWPCYGAGEGLNLMQPMNVNRSMPAMSPADTSTVSSIGSSRISPVVQQSQMKQHSKEKVLSDMGSIETSSSLLYLLESTSSSQNNSSDEQTEDMDKKRKLPQEPPWCAGVCWNDKLEYQYTLPLPDAKKVLRDGNVAMKNVNQVSLIQQQLAQLLTEVDGNHVNGDEEADYMFYSELKPEDAPEEPLEPAGPPQESDNLTKNYPSPQDDVSCTQSCLDDPSSSMQEGSHGEDMEMACEVTTEVLTDPGYPNLEPSKDGDKDTEEKASSEDSCKLLTAKSPDKLSNDSDSSETGSKDSSNLTPSDQRSTNEARSSVKESDNMSSGSGSSKESKGTESTGMNKCQFMRLFTPLHVEYDFSLQECPHWIRECNFSDEVQLLYKMEEAPSEQEDVLRQLRIFRLLRQPSAVKQQLQKLLKNLTVPKSSATEPVVEGNKDKAYGELKASSATPLADSSPGKDSPLTLAKNVTSSEDEGLQLLSSLSDESATKGEGSEDKDSQKDSGNPSGSDDKQPNSEGEEIFETVVLKESLRKVVQSSFFDGPTEMQKSQVIKATPVSVAKSSPVSAVAAASGDKIDALLQVLFQEEELVNLYE